MRDGCLHAVTHGAFASTYAWQWHGLGWRFPTSPQPETSCSAAMKFRDNLSET